MLALPAFAASEDEGPTGTPVPGQESVSGSVSGKVLLPDLVVSDLTVEKTEKGYLEIQARLSNNGKGIAKGTLSLKVVIYDEKGRYVNSLGVGCMECVLQPGESSGHGFGMPLDGFKPGKYKVVAIVDGDNYIKERNENNNMNRARFVV